MRKNLLFLVLFSLFAQFSMGQNAPKWMDKAKRAVFSIITYDKDDKILNTGNGFFISEDGVALSDYKLFKGAERAIAVNSEGKQMPVQSIMGANDMYDVIKFQVTIDKKVPALQVNTTVPAVDAEVYLVPYSTQKDKSFTAGKIKEVSKIGDNDSYYTISMKLADKMVSCPITTPDGQVLGIAQKSIGKDTTTICHAIGAPFAMALSVNALSMNDITYRNIGIKKSLPDTEQDALVALYMSSGQKTPEEYLQLLNDFIAKYPNSTDGYLRRATHLLYMSQDPANMDKANADIEQAMKVSEKKDDIHYNKAKIIYSYQLSQPETTYKDWTYDKAIEEVRKAAAIDPLPIYTQLEGDISFAMQNYQAAFECYDKVTRTNLASPGVFFSAAKAKEMMGGDTQEIAALLDSCIANCATPISEQDAPYLLERARLYMATEQYRPAMLDYDAYYTAVKGEVNDLFYYYREQASFHAKQFQRALDDIWKAIQLNPQDVTYRAELGVINLRVGRYDEAIEAFDAAIKIDSNYAEAYRLKGVAFMQQKKKTEACENFSKAKELGDEIVDSLIEKHCK